MTHIHELFSEDGQLLETYIESREVIYVGRNGKAVERIGLAINGIRQSVIFKPLTNYDTMGKEEWVYDNVFPLLPNLRFPRLYGAAPYKDADRYWLLLEDLGMLDHSNREATLTLTARAMPQWHLLPADLIPDSFLGHSPYVNDIIPYLLEKEETLKRIARQLGMEKEAEASLLWLHSEVDWEALHPETVVCHGDLIPLNVTVREHDLIVLDWEYIHRNSVYWDLYNLLDITSPNYRKEALKPATRIAVLESYRDERLRLGQPVSDTFIKDYHSYCALYSMWILLLIDSDMQNGKNELEALKAQQTETVRIWRQMLDFLAK